jgi:hypothetical protein
MKKHIKDTIQSNIYLFNVKIIIKNLKMKQFKQSRLDELYFPLVRLDSKILVTFFQTLN